VTTSGYTVEQSLGQRFTQFIDESLTPESAKIATEVFRKSAPAWMTAHRIPIVLDAGTGVQPEGWFDLYGLKEG